MKGATMTSSTLLSRRGLAAILAAGCLVAPAAAQSADNGSSGKNPARANVYVPPAPDTAARQGQRWLEARGTTQDSPLPDARKTANVYVPPSPDTARQQDLRWLEAHGTTPDYGSADASNTASVYVPPAGSYADQVRSLSDEQLAAAYGTAIPNSIPTPSGTQTIGHAASPAADDGASPWAVLGLALGCAALLGGAGLALVHRARRARRPVA
jgi:hypothetical protein